MQFEFIEAQDSADQAKRRGLRVFSAAGECCLVLLFSESISGNVHLTEFVYTDELLEALGHDVPGGDEDGK